MSITLITGPMFSGKTTELIRLIDRERIADRKCLVVKYIDDNRFDTEQVVTHSQYHYNKCNIISIKDFDQDILNDIMNKYQAIGIEEGQFFKNIDQVANTLANKGLNVYITAMDGTFKQELFGDIGKLFPLAENIIKLKAICMKCKKNDASFTVRINSKSDELIVIGGSESYISVCRGCLN